MKGAGTPEGESARTVSNGGGLLHIVPAVPPEFNGLGDYARQLWRHWPVPAPAWDVAALRVADGAGEAWPGVRFHQFSPSESGLATAIANSRAEYLVLHYVGHGYHPKGVPTWLPEALRRWKVASPSRQIAVMFHELFAVAAPWRRTFWLMPQAIRILRDLASLADHVFTSCQLYEDQLHRYAGVRLPIVRCPIGNNLAVPDSTCLAEKDAGGSAKWVVILFGLPGSRLVSAKQHQTLLSELHRHGRLGEIVSLGGRGSEAELALLRPFGEPRVVWDATEETLSAELARADLCLMHVDYRRREKSGVFAAACAHGAVPIMVDHEARTEAFLTYQASRPAYVLEQLNDHHIRTRLREEMLEQATLALWPTTTRRWAEELEQGLGRSVR